MTYRKFKADYLFTGKEMAEPDSVLITTAEGIVQAIVPAAEAGPDVLYYPGWLTPGFINCHCHLELSHMRGVLPENTGLVDFLSLVIRLRGAEPQKLAEAIAAGEQEMLAGGIVATGDICNTAGTLPVKTAGRMFYHNFIETMGFVPAGAASRFAQSLQVFQTFGEAYPYPLVANSIVPHAPYSVSEPLLKLTTGFPGNRLLTIHNQEAEAENDFYLTGKGDFLRLYEVMGLDVSFFKGTGKRSLESILPAFYRNQSLILVHNVATREEDLASIRSVNGPSLYFCLCPNANLYISGRLPDIDVLVRHGGVVVLGTDSLASNHQLSILEEMKTLQRHWPKLDTSTLLGWATVNGAKALQLESTLGDFTPGKKPGVLLLNGLEGDRLTAATGVRRLL